CARITTVERPPWYFDVW
nr:immunoglobulin heavy chain junction region [Mus musculus]MBK4187633.1 immunoglobulin heavy chain junction region [Mus musculus]